MNIDERLEFLMRSTESLHASVQELPAVVAAHTHHVEEHTRQLEIDAQNIRSLANIAAAHEGRLDNLEGR
jgi:pheromone shutdown protein TraB